MTTRRFRPLIFCLPLLAACAHAAPVPPEPVALTPAMLPSPTLAAPEGRVHVDSVHHMVVLVAGPFDVPATPEGMDPEAHDMDGMEMDHRPLIEFQWPDRGWLRGFRMALYDQHGQRLTTNLMHHFIAYNLDRRQLIHPGVERLFGAGRETGDVVAPPQVGVPLDDGTHLAVNIMWHNETGQDYHAVYMRIEMPYVPWRPQGIAYAAYPIHMDVNYHTGTSSAFDLPPGRSVHSYEFTMPIDGGIIGAGGHLHDYGVELRLEDVDNGNKVLFRLEAEDGPHGHIHGVERKVFRNWFGLKDARVHLYAGHHYRVVAVYDNPTGDTLRMAAMAHISGLFVPKDPSAWPSLNPSDPAIEADLRVLKTGMADDMN